MNLDVILGIFTAVCRNNSWRSNGILHEKRDE